MNRFLWVFSISTFFAGAIPQAYAVLPGNSNPDTYITYPLNHIASIPFENGALARTMKDDLSSGWSPSKTIVSGFVNMYNPKILKTGDAAFPYEMWFFGWAARICNQPWPKANYCDSIFYAKSASLNGPWRVYSGDQNGVPQFDTSNDVKKWVPIIHARDRYWDNWHNGDPSVVKANGIYFMAYSQTGMNRNGRHPQVNEEGNESIGGAYSLDGIHWTRLARPLLVSPIDPLSGAKPVGSHLARPSLMYDEASGKFRLWFDYWAGADGLSMGYAELPGPATRDTFRNRIFSIIQGEKNPAIAQWPNPSVVKVGDYFISASDSLSLWRSGVWAMREVSFALSKDGYRWTVVGQIPADSDCIANMVPELFSFSPDTLYLATGCAPKSGPADSGSMTSLRLRSISVSQLYANMKLLRPNFFASPSRDIASEIQSRPACVARATDQTYLQTSETYFAGALKSNSQDVQLKAKACGEGVSSYLAKLWDADWSCGLSAEAIKYVSSCVGQVQQLVQEAYNAQKYLAGKAFVDAFGSLLMAKVNGAVGAQLEPFINVCIAAQNNARNWGVAVDQFSCR